MVQLAAAAEPPELEPELDEVTAVELLDELEVDELELDELELELEELELEELELELELELAAT